MALATPNMRVGLVLEAGRGDHSFNQSGYEGATRAQHELGIDLKVQDGSGPANYARVLQEYAAQGLDLIIAMGTSGTSTVTATAQQFPNQKFVVIDDLPRGANTTGIRFRNEEGAFLAGYVAARSSSTGTVGFIGGQDVPVIHEFEAGFRAGVKFICPNCQVLSRFIGKNRDAWNNPEAAMKLAASMKAQGADVLFAVAGASGQGVIRYVNETECLKGSELPAGMTFKSHLFEGVQKSRQYLGQCAGNSRPLFFIGSNRNQNYLGDDDGNPATLNHGLTSAVNGIEEVVYTIIRDMAARKPWRSGERVLGLENNGVSYALDRYNAALISEDMQKQLENVRKLIINGGIKVPKS
ncbi:basic membrane lipoprotein [Deinococcus phoenicis]|uniref:Basic membrane lipoprotein n=2 Tax=Deinococcus phoenicis TaxID=1476583 RepID=A0A016QT65_9DEIO|nr:basic membrane lipoprotein [Deinococcus phoenicis]